MAGFFSKINELIDNYKKQQIIKHLRESQQEQPAKPVDKNYATLWDYTKEDSSSGNRKLFDYNDEIPTYEANFDTFSKEKKKN